MNHEKGRRTATIRMKVRMTNDKKERSPRCCEDCNRYIDSIPAVIFCIDERRSPRVDPEQINKLTLLSAETVFRTVPALG